MLIEHYGLWVLVCHLGHMTEDIFFCNNTKEAPVVRHKALAQPELAENVDHNLHGCVVCDGEGAHVEDATEFQRPRAVGRKGRGVRSKINS